MKTVAQSKKTFKLDVNFVAQEFVEWVDNVAEQNSMNRDHFIRYVLRQWLLDNHHQNRRILVDKRVHWQLRAEAFEKGTTISDIIESLLETGK